MSIDITDPFEGFQTWYAESLAREPGPNGVATLATVSPDGQPSARSVLYKGMWHKGFTFYTNTSSRKAEHLAANPKAALLFYWPIAGRQIRIEGSVEYLPREQSQRYFDSRPRESRIAAIASPQSSPLESRRILEERVEELTAHYGEGPIPLPDYWGGYVLTPNYFEFWQNGAHRLHHRLCFRGDDWESTILAP